MKKSVNSQFPAIGHSYKRMFLLTETFSNSYFGLPVSRRRTQTLLKLKMWFFCLRFVRGKASCRRQTNLLAGTFSNSRGCPLTRELIVFIQVHTFPPGSAPVFLEVPRNQSVYIDSNVTFDCNATGLPKPSISWIKNDDFHTLQSNSSTKDKKSIHSELSITKVKKEDFGGYKCAAINSVGKKVSLSAFLSLKGEKKNFPFTTPHNFELFTNSRAFCTI